MNSNYVQFIASLSLSMTVPCESYSMMIERLYLLPSDHWYLGLTEGQDNMHRASY